MSLSWVEVSKSALLNNIAQYRQLIGKTKLMAVVKSNAYGHGLDLVAEAIVEKIDWFGVVNAKEAIKLRDLGINKPILVLSYYDEDLLHELLRKNISIAVYSAEQIELIDAAAKKIGTNAKVHLKVDTGTSRLGVLNDQLLNLAKKILNTPTLIPEGVFSHLAASEEDAKYTTFQIESFNEVLAKLKEINFEVPNKHIACTASSVGFAESRYDLVRIGIGLYGLSSYKPKSKKIKEPKLIPALTWKAKIIQVKNVEKGTFVGYGLTFKASKPTKIAVLPVGYYEGYDRKLSNKGEVLILGRKCPVIGRICMNLLMVDVTGVEHAKIGDEVILIGDDGENRITVDDLAKKIGTINYEVVTRINSELTRILVP